MNREREKNVPWARVLLSAALALAALCLAAPLLGCTDYDEDAPSTSAIVNGVSSKDPSANGPSANSIQPSNKDPNLPTNDNKTASSTVVDPPANDDKTASSTVVDPPANNDPNPPANDNKTASSTVVDPPANNDPNLASYTGASLQDPGGGADYTLRCDGTNYVEIPSIQSINGIQIVSTFNTIDLQTLLNVQALLRLADDLSIVDLSQCHITDGEPYLGGKKLVSGESVSRSTEYGEKSATFTNDDPSALANKSYTVETNTGTLTLGVECPSVFPASIVPADSNDMLNCGEAGVCE